jgi:hypothetical protein
MPTLLNAIVLSDDLEWTDEMAWSPVSQHVEVTTGGALVVQEQAQLKGRPITLQTGNEGDNYWGVATRETVEALRALANAATTTPMLLELADGRTFYVRWRHNANGFEARPIRDAVMPQASTALYQITLRFFEV